MASQGTLFDVGESRTRAERSGSFIDNMQLSVHRWFRYSAGFSAQWAGELIRSLGRNAPRVFDPFVGSGTVVLEAEFADAEGIGVEAHPFVARVARAKLAWQESPDALRAFGEILLREAREQHANTAEYPPLITKCYPPEILSRLDALRRAWQLHSDGSCISELAWLAIVSILRSCSPVGTAPWQYVLPKKSKSNPTEPFRAFDTQVDVMVHDMRAEQRTQHSGRGQVILGDARTCEDLPDEWADLVLTSPPYANNYDYADATRLEMCFWGEIKSWGDLQSAVRERLVRACTQHVASYADKTDAILKSDALTPIEDEIRHVCSRLAMERDRHGGKKPYNAMVAHYFHDLSVTWRALRRVTRPSGKVCFVIGDSAPYGIHVPVDRWLGELALAAGFRSYRFEKLRDRNTKWKNRKHRVPLQEGRLWVEG